MGTEKEREREAESKNDWIQKMRCKKSIAQSTCKHCKRDQQIKYRPLRAARQAALPLGRYFYPTLVPMEKEQPRVSSASLSLISRGLSLLSAFTRRLRLGKGCGHGLIWPCAALLWLFRSPSPSPRLGSTGYPEKLGLGPVSYSHLVRRQRGDRGRAPSCLHSL